MRWYFWQATIQKSTLQWQTFEKVIFKAPLSCSECKSDLSRRLVQRFGKYRTSPHGKVAVRRQLLFQCWQHITTHAQRKQSIRMFSSGLKRGKQWATSTGKPYATGYHWKAFPGIYKSTQQKQLLLNGVLMFFTLQNSFPRDLLT